MTSAGSVRVGRRGADECLHLVARREDDVGVRVCVRLVAHGVRERRRGSARRRRRARRSARTSAVRPRGRSRARRGRRGRARPTAWRCSAGRAAAGRHRRTSTATSAPPLSALGRAHDDLLGAEAGSSRSRCDIGSSDTVRQVCLSKIDEAGTCLCRAPSRHQRPRARPRTSRSCCASRSSSLCDRLIERLAARGHPGRPLRARRRLPVPRRRAARASASSPRARGSTKQSMAELVAHLERHGYVERIPDPGRRAGQAGAGDGARPRGLRDRARAGGGDRTRGSTRRSGRRRCASCARCWRTCARRSRRVLGPIADGKRAPARLASPPCPPPSSPGPRAASASPSPTPSPTAAGGSSSTPATASPSSRPPPALRDRTDVVAIAGDVGDAWHRAALSPPPGDRSTSSSTTPPTSAPPRSPRSRGSPSTRWSRCCA